ncbi:MAG: RluA family pseudouridine synthase [bacterium]
MEKKELRVDLTSKQRIDTYMRDMTELSRGQIQKLVETAQVFLNQKVVKAYSQMVRQGDLIEYIEEFLEEKPPEHNDIPLDIIHEDKDILVINKQAGLVVHPAPGHKDGTLVNAIIGKHVNPKNFTGDAKRFGVVHRLDKDTSGIMVIAKHDKASIALVKMFKARELEKNYKVIVHGVLAQEGKVETFINRDTNDRKKFTAKLMHGKEALTLYYPEETFSNSTLLKVKILTGRTHQIRVHMQYIKHCVVGDSVYGDKKKDLAMVAYCGYEADKINDILPRQMLHAYNLKFIHPVTGKKMDFTAPLPQDFMKALKMLRKKR